MEIKQVTKEMREVLRMPLPSCAVSNHPTKTFLSTIKAIYVTERLNEVFGIGTWQTRVEHIVTTEKSMVVIKKIDASLIDEDTGELLATKVAKSSTSSYAVTLGK